MLSRVQYLAALTALSFTAAAWAVPPKNVIFIIGDGMGLNQVETAREYNFGAPANGSFNFQSWANQGFLSTANYSGGVTDSAAAGTALATGNKVNNGVISQAYPGDGHNFQTLLEYYQSQGKATGLVTTSYLTDATPAAFGAHTDNRGNTAAISNWYFNTTKPNVVMGGGGNSLATNPAGYTVVNTASALQAINTPTTNYLTGQFGTASQMSYELDGVGTQPHLRDMTTTALNIVDNNPSGFFLMIEGGNIDHACHSSDLPRSIAEVVELSRAVQSALDWAAGRTDTLILVTADHETGGMQIANPSTVAGVYPSVNWTTAGSHSGANVPVYAWGVNADQFNGTASNTTVFADVTFSAPDVPEPASLTLLGLGGVALLHRRRRSA